MPNPWIFFALATAVLPWLFARRRRTSEPPKKIKFPALFLLTTSPKKTFRAENRRRIALAAIRSTALVLLTFVWGAPFATNAKKNDTSADSQPIQRDDVAASESRRVSNGKVDDRPIRVLIVDGSDSGAVLFPGERGATTLNRPSAAFYVAAALDPTFDAPNVSTTLNVPNVEKITSAEYSLVSASELDVFDAILWIDLSAPTSEEIEKTERFLKTSGKALVVCAGPRLRIDRWNELWRRWKLDATSFGVEFDPATGKLRNPVETSRIDDESTRFQRSFARPFEKTPNSGLDALPIWRAFPTVGADVVPALLDAETSTPIVSKIDASNVFGLDGGSVFWVATVPDESVGALAFAPIFVPLAEQIVEFAVADALKETPQNKESQSFSDVLTNKKTSLKNARRTPVGLGAIWSVFAVVATFEILLAIPSTRRRRRFIARLFPKFFRDEPAKF